MPGFDSKKDSAQQARADTAQVISKDKLNLTGETLSSDPQLPADVRRLLARAGADSPALGTNVGGEKLPSGPTGPLVTPLITPATLESTFPRTKMGQQSNPNQLEKKLFDPLRSDKPFIEMQQAISQEDRFLALPRGQQEMVLSAMSPKVATEFEHRVLLRRLEKVVGSEVTTSLVNAGLSEQELEATLALATSQRSGPVTTFQSGAVELEKLQNLQGPDFEGLESFSDEQLVAAMGLMSPTEEASLDSELINRVVARLATQPEKMLQIQQERFYHQHLSSVELISDAALRESIKLADDYANSSIPEFASPTVTSTRMQLEGFRERGAEAEGVLQHNKQMLESSQAAVRAAKLITALGPPNDPVAQQQRSEVVAQLYTKASAALFDRPTLEFDSTAGAAAISAGVEMQRNAASRLDTAVKTMQVIRDGSVIIVAGGAAIIAAPVVFAAVATASGSTILAGGASLAVSTAVGAGTGFVYGGTVSLVENSGHVDLGNKTVEQALADIADETLSRTQQGAQAGLSAGSGSLVAGGLNSLGKGTMMKVIQGMAAGGTGTATSSTVGATADFIRARDNFFSDPANQNLSPEQFGERYAQYLRSQKLDFASLSTRVGKDAAFGMILGGLGARFQVMRDAQTSAGASFSQKLGADAAEVATATTLGFARAYFESPADTRTLQELLPLAVGETFTNINSSMQGRAAGTLRSLAAATEQPTGSQGLRLESARAIDHSNNVLQTALEGGKTLVEAQLEQAKALLEAGYQLELGQDGTVKVEPVEPGASGVLPSLEQLAEFSKIGEPEEALVGRGPFEENPAGGASRIREKPNDASDDEAQVVKNQKNSPRQVGEGDKTAWVTRLKAASLAEDEYVRNLKAPVLGVQHATDVHRGLRSDLDLVASHERARVELEQQVLKDQSGNVVKDKEGKEIKAWVRVGEPIGESPRMIRGQPVRLDQVPADMQGKPFDPDTMHEKLQSHGKELVDSYFPKPAGETAFDANAAMTAYAKSYGDLVTQAYRDGDLAPNIRADDVYRMMHENIAAAALQERAAQETTLGDHGVRHVFAHNVNKGLEVAKKLNENGVDFGAIRQLEYLTAMTYHDIGYASAPMRDTISRDPTRGFDKGHNALGAQYVRREFEQGGVMGRVFGQKSFDNMHNAILYHDSPKKGDGPDSAIKIAANDDSLEVIEQINRENLAKLVRKIDPAHFEASKLPPVLHNVEGIETVYAMKQAKEIFQEPEQSKVIEHLRDRLKDKIRARDIPDSEKDALINAVDQLGPAAYAFNMPRVSESDPRITVERSGEDKVQVVYEVQKSKLSSDIANLFGTDPNKQVVKAMEELATLGKDRAAEEFARMQQSDNPEYVGDGITIRTKIEPGEELMTPFEREVGEFVYDPGLRAYHRKQAWLHEDVKQAEIDAEIVGDTNLISALRAEQQWLFLSYFGLEESR